MILLVVAGIFILFKAWHGWRVGVVRQSMSVLAAVLGVVAGALAAKVAGPVLGQVLPFPERALGPVGGILVGFLVYLTLALLGAVLFKRTKDQGVLPVRLLYGFGGAVIGVAYAVFLVAVLAVGLRLTGTLAETKLALEKTPYLAASRPPPRDELIGTLAGLKRAAEESPLGAMLARLDPVPDATYATLGKVGKVVGNSRAIERLASSPELRPVVEHPKVVAIFREPGLNQMLIERRYTALLAQPRIVAALDDPEVVARLRAVNWDKALDHALRMPATAAP